NFSFLYVYDFSRSRVLKSLPGIKFKGAIFSHVALCNVDLTGADFSYCVMNDGSLQGSTLLGANLSHATIERTDIHKTKLSSTILNNTKFLSYFFANGANRFIATLNNLDQR